jgi:phage/plasmid-like protein (TIGR03299 family)
MAHEISIVNGKAEMAYAGDTPWHGLGTRVDGLQSAQAMIAAAGLDWSVELKRLFVWADERSTPSLECEDHRAIVRADTGRVLGVASKRYQPIQNTQAADIVDALVTEGGAHVEVAGALGRGERCWMLAHIPADFEVMRGDVVKPYFLLAWGHDGKHGIAGKLTPIRVVCHNTLTAAGLGRGVKWSRAADVYIRHYGDPTLNIEQAQKALGLARKQAEQTAEAFGALAGVQMTDTEVAEYFTRVFPSPAMPELGALMAGADPDYNERIARWTAHQERLVQLYNTGLGSELARGTAWGAYNAATEWVDHTYPVLANGKVSTTRQQSVLFGAYAGVKERALAEALALVG